MSRSASRAWLAFCLVGIVVVWALAVPFVLRRATAAAAAVLSP